MINTFTLADGYSRHVEFAQNAQPQFSSLYWNELSNILWACVHVSNVLKVYNDTIKSDNVYKRHAAFGKRSELLMTSIAVMKKHKFKNHEAPTYISACMLITY